MSIASFTCERLFWKLLRKDIEVLQGNHNPLYAAKHGGKPETEEHDEKKDRPQRRNRHLCDGLSEHNESQTGSLHSLQKQKQKVQSVVTLNGFLQM